jgi:hypothetical protein
MDVRIVDKSVIPSLLEISFWRRNNRIAEKLKILKDGIFIYGKVLRQVK